MKQLMRDALAALRKAYPDMRLITGPSEGYFQRPCIQLLYTGMGMKREMGRRWRCTDELTLLWYPPDGEDPEERAGDLVTLLGDLRPQSLVGAKSAENGVFRCWVEVQTICFLSEEAAEKMKKQVMQLQVQLGK
ncbi:MAG: hypothetical protein PUC47_05875 [Oscillospiraceae bacterium]|nr:hypothetical protein [Oscillospiraceae bacterium]